MTTADTENYMRKLYNIETSNNTIRRIIDKILPIVKEWQKQPLKDIYAVVFMDAIHYRYGMKAVSVYIAIRIDMDGRKYSLGVYVGQNESAKFQFSIFNGLKNQVVQDILISCVDMLTEFSPAIEAAFPKTKILQCIVHQIQNTTKFIFYKDIKPDKTLSADLA